MAILERLENETHGKLIMSPTMARKLLKQGNEIVDLKPKKENQKETIFIFKLTKKLLKDMENLSR